MRRHNPCINQGKGAYSFFPSPWAVLADNLPSEGGASVLHRASAEACRRGRRAEGPGGGGKGSCLDVSGAVCLAWVVCSKLTRQTRRVGATCVQSDLCAYFCMQMCLPVLRVHLYVSCKATQIEHTHAQLARVCACVCTLANLARAAGQGIASLLGCSAHPTDAIATCPFSFLFAITMCITVFLTNVQAARSILPSSEHPAHQFPQLAGSYLSKVRPITF